MHQEALSIPLKAILTISRLCKTLLLMQLPLQAIRSSNTISIRINQSMILLPEKPMMPRLYDKRVGYFSIGNIDYNSEALKADSKRYIRRWRLEPTDEAAYERGELVAPKKPIVYYLDPATPIKLRKYIKQGVDDWQKVFETAGFKNAIYGQNAPNKRRRS